MWKKKHKKMAVKQVRNSWTDDDFGPSGIVLQGFWKRKLRSPVLPPARLSDPVATSATTSVNSPSPSIRWLAHSRIARGEVTAFMVQDAAASLPIACYIASIASTGAAFPNAARTTDATKVALLSVHNADNTSTRFLRAASADMGNVVALQPSWKSKPASMARHPAVGAKNHIRTAPA